jgi:hypothetical protein
MVVVVVDHVWVTVMILARQKHLPMELVLLFKEITVDMLIVILDFLAVVVEELVVLVKMLPVLVLLVMVVVDLL